MHGLLIALEKIYICHGIALKRECSKKEENQMWILIT